MGEIFTLDGDTLGIIRTALDDLVTEMGKNCLLVYPPTSVTCDNCQSIPMPGNRVTYHWKTGGPIRFPNGGVCPACNGQGYRAEEDSETIRLLCAYKADGFLRPAPGVDVRVPNATLRVRCYLTESPKLNRADHLVYQVDASPYSLAKFRMTSKPVDESNIVQGRYAVSYWTQGGG